ncbi:ROK family protein [Rothia nasimurium]|uniref:ROK family protein n=1 Tax=Rothia nasimurium TaxID=85336 RepID=UPI001F2EC200|nr:ROK family protein [Rothia nasimurium]
MTPQIVLAADLGGTKTALGIISPTGEVLHRDKIPTQAQIGGRPLAEATGRALADLADNARTLGYEPVGIGIGSAGVIGQQGQVITAANLIKDWSGTPLAAIVSEHTGLPTYAVNDVHAHALGEAWLGAAASAETTLMVAFGTGVGGSYISGGTQMRGAHSLAGHVGHFSSPWAVGVPCYCGGTGHVEAVASGTGMVDSYRRLSGQGQVANLFDLEKAADDGDPAALDAIALGAQAAGTALGDLATILDPHLIVVSGGVVNLGTRWWNTMTSTFTQAALGQAAETPIVRATLGGDAPLLGAASLVPGFTTQP